MQFELEEIGLYGSGGKPGWFLKVNFVVGVAALISHTPLKLAPRQLERRQ